MADDLDAVKIRYKELAKRHHPDANGGSRDAEERLKTINLAYAAVRSQAWYRGPGRGYGIAKHARARVALAPRAVNVRLSRNCNRKRWTMNTAVDIAPPRPTSEINLPDTKVSARQAFDLDIDMDVPAFSVRTEHVPDLDTAYKFDRETTLAILAGFAYNRRVMIQGYHGTGKSTHIEQVAARLNWPCIRVNLDSHISRIDLIGKDAIVLKDGKQITEFREGILPWALQHACALVFDEYDAGRPDVMFVIQRVLEVEGKLTLLDQNRVIRPHPSFRLFSTANTVGLGDTTGLYHGTQQINQGQMDRWNIVATLNYLPHATETGIVLAKMGIDGSKDAADEEAHREHGGAGRPDPGRVHQRRYLDRDVASDGDHLGRECAHLRRCRGSRSG